MTRRLALVLLSGCSLIIPVDDLQKDGAAPALDAALDGAADIETSSDAPVNEAASDAGNDAGGCGFAGPTMGLIAYWPFEDGSGAAVKDCGPNKLDGTIIGTPIRVQGKKGNAIALQDPNGCVELGMPQMLAPQTFTIAMWANIASYPGGGASGYMFGKSINSAFGGWRVGTRLVDGGAVFQYQGHGPSGTPTLDVVAPPTGTWHHFAVTYDSSGAQTFVDGIPKATLASPGMITYDNGNARIGCRSDNANYFAGTIDEVRLYDRILGQSEITLLSQ